nr:hypothetical protein [Pandoravirus aubagnensis]
MGDKGQHAETTKQSADDIVIDADGRAWYTVVNRRTAWARFLAKHPTDLHSTTQLGTRFLCATNRNRRFDIADPVNDIIKSWCYTAGYVFNPIKLAYKDAQSYCRYTAEPERCVADLVTAIYDDDDPETQPVPYVPVDEVPAIIAKCGVPDRIGLYRDIRRVTLMRVAAEMGGPVNVAAQGGMSLEVRRGLIEQSARYHKLDETTIQCLRDALPLRERPGDQNQP